MDYFEEEYMRQMSSRIGCLPILLLCIALSFVGCKTIRQTEYVAIHDTLHVHHSDTVREYKIKTVHDTIRESSNHILTLNEKGDTIREYHYYHEKEKIVEKDSTDKYKSSIDSLKSVLNKIHEKEKVTEKKPSFWGQWKWRLISCALLVALVLALIPIVKRIISRFMKSQSQ